MRAAPPDRWGVHGVPSLTPPTSSLRRACDTPTSLALGKGQRSNSAAGEDMPPTPSSMEMGGVSTVKVGADGKESALLVRRGAGRWICLLATVLVLGIGGAWYTHDSRLKGKAEMSRLTRLLRDTGSRVDALRRVSDRLEDSEESSEAKEKIAKELKIGSEVHKAQVEHARAQANVMKRGSEPNVLHAAAADKAAQAVPARGRVQRGEGGDGWGSRGTRLAGRGVRAAWAQREDMPSFPELGASSALCGRRGKQAPANFSQTF